VRAARAAEALHRFYAAAEKPLSVDDIQLGVVRSPPGSIGTRRGRSRARRAARLAHRRLTCTAHAEPVAYLKDIQAHDITFGIAPAPGKNLPARGLRRRRAGARRGESDRARAPRVEPASGWVPARDLAQKVDPYCALLRALYDLMGFDRVGKLFERQAIEVAPLAYMRGRTLNHSFIILDEAQNTTPSR